MKLATAYLFLSLAAGSIFTPWAAMASGIVPSFADPVIEKAVNLFVPIVCTSPTGYKLPAGTGFPIGPETVMSAAHVSCLEIFGPHAQTEISDDGGLHWMTVDPNLNLAHAAIDVRIMRVPGAKFKTYAKFRAPRLGEEATAYGIAFGASATFGRIARLANPDDPYKMIYATNTGISGMSGSALIGKDGKVIGMVVVGTPTNIAGHVASWLTGAIDGTLLEIMFRDYQEKVQNAR